MAAEPCAGCGDVADHPVIGVTRDKVTQQMTGYPICLACWRDPTHRKVPLKMHFFDQRVKLQAVQAAERNILVTPPNLKITGIKR